jgi:hypothetical protein
MSLRDNEREKERSARKKAEIDAEVNTNKEIVYNYIAARKDVSGKECVEELGFFNKGKCYLEWLALRGHLTRDKRTIGGKRLYVYNAAIPYIKPISDLPATLPTKDDKLVQSVTRVINLMDRPQEPRTKEERERLRRSSKSVAIGSSMQMFGSW